MAPEQALNEQLGPYTDLYATRDHRLRAARGPAAVRLRHAGRAPLLPGAQDAAPARRDAPEPRPRVVRVGHMAAVKAPADRPQSAAEAWDALEESTVAELGPYWRRTAAITRHPSRRRPWKRRREPPTTERGSLPPTTHAPLPCAARRWRRAVVAAARSRGGRGGGRRARRRSAAAGDPGGSAAKPRADSRRGPRRRSRTTSTATAGRSSSIGDPARLPRGASTKSGVVLVRRPRHALPLGRRSRRTRPASPAARAPATTSAPASPAVTSTATAGPTSRSARRAASACRCSTADGTAWVARRSRAAQAAGARMPPGARALRLRLLARDLNGDGVSDLARRARPASGRASPATGALDARRSAASGEGWLDRTGSASCSPIRGTLAGFGSPDALGRPRRRPPDRPRRGRPDDALRAGPLVVLPRGGRRAPAVPRHPECRRDLEPRGRRRQRRRLRRHRPGRLRPRPRRSGERRRGPGVARLPPRPALDPDHDRSGHADAFPGATSRATSSAPSWRPGDYRRGRLRRHARRGRRRERGRGEHHRDPRRALRVRDAPATAGSTRTSPGVPGSAAARPRVRIDADDAAARPRPPARPRRGGPRGGHRGRAR